MILGGIVGALVVPILSDKIRKRVPFIILAIGGAAIGVAGLTYVTGYLLLLLFSFIFGFFLLAAGPIGFQYAAEITYPAPEGTSNGLVLLMGQISGILFILGMDALKSHATGAMTLPLAILLGLFVVCVLLTVMLKEAPAMRTG